MATQTQSRTSQTSRTQAQRKATAQKAAATRRRKSAARSRSAKKAAETRAQAQLNTLQVVQAQAERGVLIPVGAALTARDAVIEAVGPYFSGRDSAEKEIERVGKRVSTSLKRFERRGSTARNRAVREVKKTRTRVERELRQRRTKAVRTVKQNRREAERQVKSARREFEIPRRLARLTTDLPLAPRGEGRRGEAAGEAGSAVSLLPHQRRPFGGGVGLFLNWDIEPCRPANRSRTSSAA